MPLFTALRATYRATLILFVIATMACPTTAAAQDLDTIADSYISSHSEADDTHGDEQRVRIRNDRSDTHLRHRKSYLHFDLGNLGMAAGDIAQATLDLRLMDAFDFSAGSGGSTVLRLYGLGGADWSPATITWNNAPGNSEHPGELADPAELLAVLVLDGSAAADSTITFGPDHLSVDDHLRLRDFLRAHAGGPVTLVLASETPQYSSISLASSRHATLQGPRLRISDLVPTNETHFASLRPASAHTDGILGAMAARMAARMAERAGAR
jgi:hypothetical protein